MSALPHNVALVTESKSVPFSDLTDVAAALQKQATRDFGPLWKVSASVGAFASLDDVPVDYWPVILMDNIKSPGAAGYHTDKNGQPYALVQVDDTWPLTVSHETLEMLADPFGNRVLAGAPPVQAPAEIQKIHRVVYLVEVCDPCEDGTFAYDVNGVTVSDFITHHYYDPHRSSGARYSFTGSIPSPHHILDNGYVSFGNPVDNHWYQIFVENGQPQLVDLGVLNTNGKSLRETIDCISRGKRPHYRIGARVAAAAAGAGKSARQARAASLREDVRGLQ